MNRFKNSDYYQQFNKDWQADTSSKYLTLSSIFASCGDESGESYQDLYDMLSDDYRCGYHGERKTKLLLYIAHRAYRDHGVIIHTGCGVFPGGEESTSTDPYELASVCEQYDSYEREEVREYLAGIR